MDYKFVEKLSEEYTCQICMKLLKEPQLTNCCGQHFCRACLEQWFRQQYNKQCPHCRKVNITHIISWPLQRKINELKVYCSNRAKGCRVMMKLGDLERHLSDDNPNECGYVTVKCPNEGCVVTCLRKDLRNHSNKMCLRRKVKCIYCGSDIEEIALDYKTKFSISRKGIVFVTHLSFKSSRVKTLLLLAFLIILGILLELFLG